MSHSTRLDYTDLHQVENIRMLTERAASRWGEKTGLVFDQFDQSFTFREIHEWSDRYAWILQHLGVKPGDRIGIMLRNVPEFPLVWLAIGKIGATMVPINVYYKEFDAKYLIEHSELSLVVTSSEFVPLLNGLRKLVPTFRQIVSVDECSEDSVLRLHQLGRQVKPCPLPTVHADAILNIQYTSGTTGRPKGCLLSQRYWFQIARVNILEPSPALNESDVMLTAQPFYYIDPQWNLITALASGARLIVLDRFHPSTFWEKVRKHGVTYFYCLGVMPLLMLKMPESPEDRNNRVRYISCSAIPVHLHAELERRWGAPWYESFGMTEIGEGTTVTKEEHDRLVGTGCIGRPVMNREVRILGDDGQVLPRGQIGELVFRGTDLMDGYFKDPEMTREAYRSGFFHTGDLAYMTEDGLIYYVGRKKDMIRRSGENISATEVEDALKLHPAVQNVAVVAVPDELRGEEVKAYIVPRNAGSDPRQLAEQLIEFCSGHLAYFKIPRYWEFRSSLPLTPSEKVAKHELIKQAKDLRANSYDRVDQIWRGDIEHES